MSIVCPHCKSSWNSSATVSQCPFCKKPLIKQDKNNNSYSDMLTLLKDVRQEFGVEVFSNTVRVKSILKDKAPDLKKEINLLLTAMNSGLYSDSLRHIGEQAYYVKLLKNRHILIEEYYMSELGSSKITEWYCCLLDIRYDNKAAEPKLPEKQISSGMQPVKKTEQPVKKSAPVTGGEYRLILRTESKTGDAPSVNKPFKRIDGEYRISYKKPKDKGTQNQAGAPVSKPSSVMNQDRYPSVAAAAKSDEEKRRRSLINEEDTSYSMNSSVKSYTPGYTKVDEPESKTESVDSEQKAADEIKLYGNNSTMIDDMGCLLYILFCFLAFCTFIGLMCALFWGVDSWETLGFFAGATVVSFIIARAFDKKY